MSNASCLPPRLLRSLALVLAVAAPAFGADRLDARLASLSLDGAAGITQQPAPEAKAFGDAGSWWWSVGGGGLVGGKRLDAGANVNFQLHYFIVDSFEMGLEFGGFLFDQPAGGDAVGGGFNLNFRWHFFQRGRWTVFAEGGAGVLGTSDEVPDRGTEFNFTPRAGLGATLRLGEGGTRLMFGARWQHISNARIDGSDRNPGEDAAMAYASIIFPF